MKFHQAIQVTRQSCGSKTQGCFPFRKITANSDMDDCGQQQTKKDMHLKQTLSQSEVCLLKFKTKLPLPR
jgi:hypothetical protein